MFTYVNAKFPGCSHDAFIFSQSALHNAFYTNFLPQGYVLVGDSGFGNSNYLVTPFSSSRNITAQQLRYNKAHKKSRVIIEQSFGVLKRRFAILKSSLRVKPKFGSQIIVACCALHNLFILCGWTIRRQFGNRVSRMPFPGVVNNTRDFMMRNI